MKARYFGRSYARGVSTLEILIAFSILLLSISAVIMVVFGTQSLAIDTETNIEAIGEAQALLETVRAEARANFSSVQPIATTSDDIYQKSVTITPVGASTKQATSIVSWKAGDRNLSVHFSTLLADWTHPGNKCDQVLTGDWTTPQALGYFDSTNAAGATSVYVTGTKAYLTSDPSSAATHDFYVIDVSNPKAKPLPLLGSFSTSYGLTSVAIEGVHAYVSADSASYQLLVIDVSNAASLSQANIQAKVDLTASGDAATGKTLAYADSKIYLGLTKSSGAEFRIIDVSNSSSPVQIGPGYEVSAAVNSISLQGTTAYLATASTTPLIALDVSDPTHPVRTSSFSSATLTGQSIALDPQSIKLYFGRIGGNGNPKLLAFNTPTLTSPAWTMNMGAQSGVYAMLVRSSLLFITTADPADGLQIWNVSNPSSLTRFDAAHLNIQQGSPAGLDCFGNLLYVGEHGTRALQIVGPP